MSRSGYSKDDDNWSMIRWRGAVNAAIRGRRGQQALRDILAALEAMPEKKLAADSLVTEHGEYCTLGVLGAQRGIPIESIDPYERDEVAQAFGIAPALAAEIVYENDQGAGRRETPEERWIRMRAWVVSLIDQSAG